MKIVVDNKKAFTVISVTGKMMGGSDTGALDEKLYALLAKGIKKAIVDLSSCEWIDASGLSILIHHHKKFYFAGGELVLVLPKESKIERIMVISRLTEVFRIFESQDEALMGLKTGPPDQVAK